MNLSEQGSGGKTEKMPNFAEDSSQSLPGGITDNYSVTVGSSASITYVQNKVNYIQCIIRGTHSIPLPSIQYQIYSLSLQYNSLKCQSDFKKITIINLIYRWSFCFSSAYFVKMEHYSNAEM